MTFEPVYMKDVTLDIDGSTFEAEVSAATLNPSTSVTRWKGLTSASRHSKVAVDWSLDLTVGQDPDEAASLHRFLLENVGVGKVAKLYPRGSASGRGYQVTVTIAPAAIGGSVETFAESTVSLPANGTPTPLPAA